MSTKKVETGATDVKRSQSVSEGTTGENPDPAQLLKGQRRPKRPPEHQTVDTDDKITKT